MVWSDILIGGVLLVEVGVEGNAVLGQYRFVELLGPRGMVEVWQAYDTAMDRVVALKVLSATVADDPVSNEERFTAGRPMRTARLDEPHAVPIYDFGEIDGRAVGRCAAACR